MALYLGSSEELKINLDGVAYCVKLLLETPIENGIRLLSSEGFFLKDSSGLYLTIKESE
jgi:hypothetical protein